MTNVLDIDALAGKLIAAMPQLDATKQRIALTLVRQLACGACLVVLGDRKGPVCRVVASDRVELARLLC